MCMGGGGGESQYDAYKKGDYQQWENLTNRAYAIQRKLDAGAFTDPAVAAAKEKRYKALDRQADALSKKVQKDTAARLDMREHTRQEEIKSGRKNINRQFKSFNDTYYDDYGQKYLDFYTPQLDDQYADARGKLIAALAGKGTLESTAGIGKIGDLAKERDTAATTFANEAQDAKNKLRANVEKTKSDLYSLNEASADASALNTRAIGEATALVAPPAYNPIGQVFASFLQPILSGFGQGGGGASYPSYSSPVYRASGAGSGTVYR